MRISELLQESLLCIFKSGPGHDWNDFELELFSEYFCQLRGFSSATLRVDDQIVDCLEIYLQVEVLIVLYFQIFA